MAGGLKHNSTIAMSISAKDEVSPVLNRVNQSFKNTKKQTNALNQQFRFMRGGLGQVGHQIQDVAVQLQMGQNAMLVFGQQGSQIASLFGPHGAIVGAFLAVGAAVSMALLPSLFGASKALKAVKEESKSLIDNFDNLDDALKAIAIAQAKKEIDELTQEMERQEKKIEKLTGRNENLTGQMKRNKKTQQELDKVTQEYKDNIVLLNAAKDRLIKKTDNSSDAFEKMRDKLLQEADTIGMGAEALALYEISLMNVTEQQKQYLAALRLSNIARQKEIDLSEANKKAIEKEVKEMEKREEKMQAFFDKEFEKKQAAKIKEQEKAMQDFQDTYRPIFDELGDGFTEAITGAKNFEGAIKGMAKSVVDSLLRIAVQKLIIDQLFGAFTGVMGPRQGAPAPVATANPIGFDGGGFTGNGARSGGLDGKGGFMAMIHPRETVVDHTKGQSTGGVTVVQHINVTTGVQQTVRAEIATLMPQIANAAKNAVADSRMRGGSYGKALGA